MQQNNSYDGDNSAVDITLPSHEEDTSDHLNPCKVHLPTPIDTVSSIDHAVWGILKGTQITDAVNHAYSVIVRWRKNLFKVPTGKAGQEFIEEVRKTLSHYVSGSHLESVALTMSMIIFPMLLQKPSRSSKSKDHVNYLTKRLALWRSVKQENFSVKQENLFFAI